MDRNWVCCVVLLTASAAASAAAAGELRKAGPSEGAAVITYIVSQHNLQLTTAEKTVLSQDFNGAPLDGKPKLHTVTARSVSCHAIPAPAGHTPPRCSISFGQPLPVRFGGDDAERLFSALGKAGAAETANADRIQRRLRDLNCTVDDAKAQGTPSSGDDVAGFSCTFRTAP